MSSENTEKKPCALVKLFRGLWRTIVVLLWIVVILLIAILAGGLGPMVKYVGVPVANKLGIPVSIEKCVILPLGGYVCIEGLQVENPKSFITEDEKTYKETPLARLGKFEADFAMRSLLSDEYCVDSLQLSGVRALYAFDMDTTNVDALLQELGIEKPAPEETPAEEPVVEPTVETPAEETVAEDAKPVKPIRFRLAYVNLEDNSVTIRKFVSIPIPLPPLTLHDVDNEKLIEKLETLVKPVVTTVTTAKDGIGSGIKQLGDGASAVKDSVLNIGSGSIDTTKEALDSGKKSIKEGAKAVEDSLKSLFGR